LDQSFEFGWIIGGILFFDGRSNKQSPNDSAINNATSDERIVKNATAPRGKVLTSGNDNSSVPDKYKKNPIRKGRPEFFRAA
jgi:hypothetical protein